MKAQDSFGPSGHEHIERAYGGPFAVIAHYQSPLTTSEADDEYHASEAN